MRHLSEFLSAPQPTPWVRCNWPDSSTVTWTGWYRPACLRYRQGQADAAAQTLRRAYQSSVLSSVPAIPTSPSRCTPRPAAPACLATPSARLPCRARPATSSATSCLRTSRRLPPAAAGSPRCRREAAAYARKPWCPHSRPRGPLRCGTARSPGWPRRPGREPGIVPRWRETAVRWPGRDSGGR